MVTTRASSRESTPAASVRGDRVRTLTRRSTTAPIEVGTPSSRTRTRKAGPQATARSGHTSYAYGVGSQATASRVASRTLQGFSSALEDELIDQEEFLPDPHPEPSIFLAPVAEEERRSLSRESTPVSKASSSLSNSPTALAAAAEIGKSFSHKREGGLRDTPGPNYLDFPEPTTMNAFPWVQQQQAISERVGAAVFDLANGAKVFFNNYWRVLLGLLVALTFGSLLAAYGIPTLDRFLPSGSVSAPGYPHPGDTSHTTTVVSYISKPSDPAVASRLKHLESRVLYLEDELSRSKSTTGSLLKAPFNHISASIGATIVPGLTSPTKRTVSSLLIPLSKLWTPPGMKGPLTALQPWSEPGQCWCTPADRAALGVRAPYPVRAGAVTIEHILSDDLADSGHDLSTAPSLVEIWAKGGDGEVGECLGEAPGKEWSCLGRMDMRRRVLGEEVRSWTMDLAVEHAVAQDFAFVVVENRGSVAATCLYRVQLHGEKV